jgi:Xaa-Pro aminopeptidase
LVLLTKAIQFRQWDNVKLKAMHPGMSETEIQGIHEFVYKKYGSEFEDILRMSAQEQRLCVTLY